MPKLLLQTSQNLEERVANPIGTPVSIMLAVDFHDS